jgi:undecaprenyl-diphosphatase
VAWLLHLDSTVLLWINQFAQHSHVFDHIVVVLISQEVLQGSCFFLFLWWLWFRHPEAPLDDRIDVIRIVAAICVADILGRVLQWSVPVRVRPINDPTLAFVLPYTEWPSALEHWSSFPSDHAIVYYALATAIWARHRLMGVLAFVWVTAFSSFARIYTGLHYPGDVLGGAIIGILVMRLADALLVPRPVMPLIRRVLSWEVRYPAPFYVLAVLGTLEFMTMCDDLRVIARGLAAVTRGAG